MIRKRRSSPPPPVPSSTRRSRHSIHDEDLDDDLHMTPNIYNDCQDQNSESDDKPLRQPSRNVIGTPPLNDSFMSTFGKQVRATQETCTSTIPLHPERREVNIVSEEEDHQQQLQFPSETSGCSGRLRWLWRNFVPSDGKLHPTRRPGDGSRCIASAKCILVTGLRGCAV